MKLFFIMKSNPIGCYSPNCPWGIGKVYFFTFRRKEQGLSQNELLKIKTFSINNNDRAITSLRK